jgi:LEA14-like dessication related protein
MNIIRIMIMALLAISLTACAGIRPQPPEVQLSGLEISDVSLSHANFLATLKLFNPNSIGLDIEGLKFTLFLNDVRVAKGQTAKVFSIPAEDSRDVAVRLSSSFLDLFQLTRSLQNQQEVNFRIVGEIRIDGAGMLGRSIPLEREGTLPLSGSLNQLRPDSQLFQPMDSPEKQILRQ